ncbi:type II secretion system protein [bacterium]|nr:MAG: type II secretion system protein [bacterium]
MFLREKAFTLTEILVAMAIIAVLAGLSVGAWSSARKSALERSTENSLRQAWLALELYRSDADGHAEAGTSSQMGLPNVDGFHALLKKGGITFWQQAGSKGYGPVYYPYDPSDLIVGLEEPGRKKLEAWLKTVQHKRSDVVLFADFSHTEGCGEMPQPDCVFTGIGITASGAIRKQKSSGEIGSPRWWESNTP